MTSNKAVLVAEVVREGVSSVAEALTQQGFICNDAPAFEMGKTLYSCLEHGEAACLIIDADQFPEFTDQVLEAKFESLPDTPILLLTKYPALLDPWSEAQFGKLDIALWADEHAEVLVKAINSLLVSNEATKRENQYRNNVLVGRRLLTLIGHELRVPLETLRYTQQQLCQIEMDDRAKTLAAHCRRVASYMCEYVGNIVEFSRIEKNTDGIFNEEFCVETLVRECFDLLWSHSHSKGLELGFSPSSERNIYFEGDRKKIRQILINIVSNAIRYTGEGSVMVSIRREDGLTIEVSDTGIGMSPKRLKEVFVDDHSGVSSASGALHAGGLGIGVALCKKLTRSLHGKLTAKSLETGGTSIKAWFPSDNVLKSHRIEEDNSSLVYSAQINTRI